MLVYFALTLVVLLGFVGLAVDVGRMELCTIQLQAVADDAALTAAAEFQNGTSTWQSLATAEAKSAGTAAGLSSVSASFTTPATTGPYTIDHSSIQATVTQQIPLTFMGLVTASKTKTLTATAVADFQPCSYYNTPNGGYTFYLASASTYAPCPVYVAGGIGVDYFGNFNVMQGKATGAASSSYMGGSAWNTPIYNTAVQPDPLAYITAPVFQACTAGDSNLVITTPKTLNPGTYCGGLSIKGTTVTLQPGLYIITGGFSLTQAATINGTGVTLYFTQGGGSGFGNVTFGTGSGGWVNAFLSAPTDNSNGGIPAVVLYTDPSWTGAGKLNFNSCYWSGEGIFYSQVASVFVWASSLDHGTYFGMDVSSIYVFGTDVHLIPNYAGLPGGNPFHVAATLVQ